MAKRTKSKATLTDAPVSEVFEGTAPDAVLDVTTDVTCCVPPNQNVSDILVHFSDTAATLRSIDAASLGLESSEMGLIMKHVSEIQFILHMAMARAKNA